MSSEEGEGATRDEAEAAEIARRLEKLKAPEMAAAAAAALEDLTRKLEAAARGRDSLSEEIGALHADVERAAGKSNRAALPARRAVMLDEAMLEKRNAYLALAKIQAANLRLWSTFAGTVIIVLAVGVGYYAWTAASESLSAGLALLIAIIIGLGSILYGWSQARQATIKAVLTFEIEMSDDHRKALRSPTPVRPKIRTRWPNGRQSRKVMGRSQTRARAYSPKSGKGRVGE